MKLDSKTYVKQAEDVIKKLNTDKFGKVALTTSQIRNLLTMTNELYNVIQHDIAETLSEEVQSRTQYIKMKIAYNAGRDRNVKDLVEKSYIMEYLDGVGDKRDQLMLVCHYMEALVAYHKYYRGEND